MRKERDSDLSRALAQIPELDREILVLRHFEELTNAEVAAVLALSPTAASNRYVRALRRLRTVMRKTGEGSDPTDVPPEDPPSNA